MIIKEIETQKQKLIPKPNQEYIYTINEVWNKNKHYSKTVVKEQIVENVVLLNDGNYEFNFKGDTEKFQCFYGWAFVENNQKNIDLIEKLNQEKEILAQQDKKVQAIRDQLDSLYK